MSLIINPGSRIQSGGEGWTNTVEGARKKAEEWQELIRAAGHDVFLMDGVEERDGRWVFGFQHNVTGVIVELETHGIDNLEAYEGAHVFTPRVYWHGSSVSTPELEDWAADGFEAVRTYRWVD